MVKKKKTAAQSIGEFSSSIPEEPEQTEAYRPPVSTQNRSSGGVSGRNNFSSGRERDSGNRKNNEKKEEAHLDFRQARNTQIAPEQQQQQQQQQPRQSNDRFSFNRQSDRSSYHSHNNDESGVKKGFTDSSPTLTPTSELAYERYVPPSKKRMQEGTGIGFDSPSNQSSSQSPNQPPSRPLNQPSNQPPSQPPSGRFASLGLKHDRKPERKPETKATEEKMWETILNGFTRGPELATEIFALESAPSVIEITMRILELTPHPQIYEFNWLSEDTFKPLFREYINRNSDARLGLILAGQKFSCNCGFPEKNSLSLFSAILFTLYKEDLISETDITEKWKNETQQSVKALKSKAEESCGNFLFWLENVEAEDY